MELDEQISLMEELLNDDDHWSCENAKSEYRQVQEWLKELRKLKKCRECPLIEEECKRCGFKEGGKE